MRHRTAVKLRRICLALLLLSTAATAAEPALRIEFTSEPTPALRAVAARWVQRAQTAVSLYYGRPPTEPLLLQVTPRAGRTAEDGVATGYAVPLVTISLGRDSTDASLADDWVLTHEMLHLRFPSLHERHHWLEEGMASYVEPIARARAGQITPEHAWHDLLEGAPDGQPARGDRGLDFTPTWGRTYWGGAVFCLRADVEIRRRTGNRQGLEHALRAIHAAGGRISAAWPIDRVISVGDRATGVPVLRELYDESKATPFKAPLDQLWRDLGVRLRGQTVTFDDTAPLSAIRRAMTQQ